MRRKETDLNRTDSSHDDPPTASENASSAPEAEGTEPAQVFAEQRANSLRAMFPKNRLSARTSPAPSVIPEALFQEPAADPTICFGTEAESSIDWLPVDRMPIAGSKPEPAATPLAGSIPMTAATPVTGATPPTGVPPVDDMAPPVAEHFAPVAGARRSRRRFLRVAAIVTVVTAAISAVILAGGLSAHHLISHRRDSRSPQQPEATAAVGVEPSPTFSPSDHAGIASASAPAPPPAASVSRSPSSAASRPAVPAGPLDGTGAIVGLDGQCLDNRWSVLDDGNPIQAWICDTTPAQTWTVSDSRFSVQGKCMTSAGGGGNAVVLMACNGAANQLWQANAADNSIRNPATGLCLTATAANTPIAVLPCNGVAGQKWTRR